MLQYFFNFFWKPKDQHLLRTFTKVCQNIYNFLYKLFIIFINCLQWLLFFNFIVQTRYWQKLKKRSYFRVPLLLLLQLLIIEVWSFTWYNHGLVTNYKRSYHTKVSRTFTCSVRYRESRASIHRRFSIRSRVVVGLVTPSK